MTAPIHYHERLDFPHGILEGHEALATESSSGDATATDDMHTFTDVPGLWLTLVTYFTLEDKVATTDVDD